VRAGYDVRVADAVAVTRDVSPALAACELTHLARAPIDLDRARAQHGAYEVAIADAGYRVERLPADPGMPDCVFVEDIAIVVPEIAIVTRPGAASRRGETPAVAAAMSRYRTVRNIEAPGTLDGGDVLIAGHRVFVGISSRTTPPGAAQLRRLLEPYGYDVTEVSVRGCLHLKSAATAVAEDLLLINPEWVDATVLDRLDHVTVDPREPSAANALRLRDRVIFPSAFPRTAERLEARGLRLVTVDASELAKAEGAVTCCCVLVDVSPQA